jgi:hypothetical protein
MRLLVLGALLGATACAFAGTVQAKGIEALATIDNTGNAPGAQVATDVHFTIETNGRPWIAHLSGTGLQVFATNLATRAAPDGRDRSLWTTALEGIVPGSYDAVFTFPYAGMWRFDVQPFAPVVDVSTVFAASGPFLVLATAGLPFWSSVAAVPLLVRDTPSLRRLVRPVLD